MLSSTASRSLDGTGPPLAAQPREIGHVHHQAAPAFTAAGALQLAGDEEGARTVVAQAEPSCRFAHSDGSGHENPRSDRKASPCVSGGGAWTATSDGPQGRRSMSLPN